MEEMESTRDLTRLPMAFQYLNKLYECDQGHMVRSYSLGNLECPQKTNTPHNREADRRYHLEGSGMGNEGGSLTSHLTRVYSRMELQTTKKSKRLKRETM